MELQDTKFYKQFEAERQEILKHKWYESEKAGHDVGFGRALIDWTIKFKTKWLKDRKKQANK